MNPYAQHKPPEGGSGLYLKLEDGETVKLRICSEPHVFQSEYKGNWSTRYVWRVFNYEDGSVQALQLSPTVFKQIQTLAVDPDWGDPTKYSIKLTRKGTGTDTVYNVVPTNDKLPLSVEQQDKVNKFELTGLKGLEAALPISQVLDAKDAPKAVPSHAPIVDEIPVEQREDPGVVPF